jgi:hypothetical protein
MRLRSKRGVDHGRCSLQGLLSARGVYFATLSEVDATDTPHIVQMLPI